MVGVTSVKELTFDHHDTMLLLSNTADAWKTAGPVTKITDSLYPFNKNKSRPTAKEVRYEMHSVFCKIKIRYQTCKNGSCID